MLLISTLTRMGLLPLAADPWPPPVCRMPLEGFAEAVIRAAEHDGALPMSLELHLPGPSGRLTVPIERLPFHRSPGRWHFRCACCGRLKGVLVEVDDSTPRATAVARALGWACRTCMGLPKSRAWSLGAGRRLDNALDRAAEVEVRRPGEKARDWRRRRQRAAKAEERAASASVDLVDRLKEVCS
jgi:hypothetical protein